MPAPTVKYHQDGHIAYITRNRPRSLNAVNQALERDLSQALHLHRTEDFQESARGLRGEAATLVQGTVEEGLTLNSPLGEHPRV